MGTGSVLKRLATIRSVPAHVILVTALASYSALMLARFQGWPLWGIVLAALLPWVPILTVEVTWTYRHYAWLALFYVLVVTQAGHVLEHVAQMVQLHLLDLQGSEARGVFGALDTEWVHVVWNTWVLAAVVALLVRFGGNPWLWLTLVVAGWHEVEHIVIMLAYLSSGVAGTPGLLSSGGALFGGVPLPRPDLHFLYNLVETTPLVIAFVHQLRRSHDEWLARALPHLPEPLLVATTGRLEIQRFPAGRTIVREGSPADTFYIVARGEVEVVREDAGGRQVRLAILEPGQFFGEVGLLVDTPRTASVRAKSPVELLAVDRETFRMMVSRSEATAHQLDRVIRERLGGADVVHEVGAGRAAGGKISVGE